MTYTIYHIPGIKIGVTDNLIKRMRVQRFESYEILEEHTDIYEVSNRELELQRQYGLPVDKMPYWKVVQKNQIPKSETTKQKQREAQTGKTYTQESKDRMSDSAKGNSNALGHVRTEENKQKISDTLKGRPASKIQLDNLTTKIKCPYCEMKTNRGNLGRHIKAKHE